MPDEIERQREAANEIRALCETTHRDVGPDWLPSQEAIAAILTKYFPSPASERLAGLTKDWRERAAALEETDSRDVPYDAGEIELRKCIAELEAVLAPSPAPKEMPIVGGRKACIWPGDDGFFWISDGVRMSLSKSGEWISRISFVRNDDDFRWPTRAAAESFLRECAAKDSAPPGLHPTMDADGSPAAYCDRCGERMTLVRPGSHQCDNERCPLNIVAARQLAEREAAPAPQSTAVPQGEATLPARVLAMCKARGWSLHWTARGAYLHLESSELIEAIRGKHGNKKNEAADVLLVLMSITESNGMAWGDVEAQASNRCAELMATADKPYAGEERAAAHASQRTRVRGEREVERQ